MICHEPQALNSRLVINTEQSAIQLQKHHSLESREQYKIQ